MRDSFSCCRMFIIPGSCIVNDSCSPLATVIVKIHPPPHHMSKTLAWVPYYLQLGTIAGTCHHPLGSLGFGIPSLGWQMAGGRGLLPPNFRRCRLLLKDKLHFSLQIISKLEFQLTRRNFITGQKGKNPYCEISRSYITKKPNKTFFFKLFQIQKNLGIGHF